MAASIARMGMKKYRNPGVATFLPAGRPETGRGRIPDKEWTKPKALIKEGRILNFKAVLWLPGKQQATNRLKN